VITHKAAAHVGSDDADSYSSYDGWKCPFGNMGNQYCSLPAAPPYQSSALAIDCGIAEGGCPAHIPRSDLSLGGT
jgi:hypothetical protein